ncbi:hypothetical protein ACS0TY_027966 [Phlomoides rotata]
MGECASDWDWLYTEDRTMILVGRSGNGKSATGNSIIEANVFDEMPSSACVITSCRRRATALCNGQILTVIDTPGSFDVSDEREIIGLEIGIHAVLLVVSLIKRFSSEESLVIESLTRFFGAKLSDYMIVVFTHGDALEDMPLNDYLGCNCPDQLMRTLEMCGNRFVIFDNVTEDKFKKYRQREELLRLVDEVVANNGGIPYTHELFVEQKTSQFTEVEFSERFEIESKLSKEYEDQLLQMESKHREMTLRLEKQLEGERVARLQAEADAQSTKAKSDVEISKARTDVKRAQREVRKLRKTHRVTKELLKKNIQERKNNALAIAHQIGSRLRETTLRLENQLADKFTQMQAQRKSDDEMRKLREDMDRARKYADDAFKKLREDMEENQKKNDRAISEKTSANEHKIDSKIRERIVELEKMLADDQIARMQAEAKTQEVEKKLNDERENRSTDSVSKTETSASRDVFSFSTSGPKTNPSDVVNTCTSVFSSTRRTPTDSPPSFVFASSRQSRQIYDVGYPVLSWL